MEEDIKILEELINANVSFKTSPEDRGYKAIENLIKGYRELEEENEIYKEELEKIDKALNLEAGRVAPYRHEIIISLKKGIVQLNKIIGNSIPKSKIKEIIEELEKEKEEYYSQYKIDELNDKIQVLQELMEDK